MSIFDIIIILPVIWGIYKGFTKGLIVEIASLTALALGIWGATKFYNYTAGIIEQNVRNFQQYLPIISYTITFLIIVIAINILAKILDKLIKIIALGLINRILGSIFAALNTCC